MVRTRQNIHTVNSSNNDNSSNKTLTESNINNQEKDTTSNINTNESQPSNILRTSTLDDQVIITNSLETLSPNSNVKKQPVNKNTTTIPTESIQRTDTLSFEMNQLTAQEKPQLVGHRREEVRRQRHRGCLYTDLLRSHTDVSASFGGD